MKPSFNFQAPTRIIAGNDTLAELPSIVGAIGRNVLVITDPGVSAALDVPGTLAGKIAAAGLRVSVFDEIEPNPRVHTVSRAAEKARVEKADVLVAIGGGSVIDSTKGTAIVATHGGEIRGDAIWEFVGDDRVPGPVLPIVTVPTTAGTGSEVNPFAVFTREDTHRKDGLASRHIFPRVAILDPASTKGLPPNLTAETGIDALAHAIEGVTSKACDHFSAALAKRAVALVARSLVRAVEDGSCAEARLDMATASALAGLAIVGAGVGMAHGFGMSIGGLYDAPHGRVIGVLLPDVMDFNATAAAERFQDLAQILSSNDPIGLFEGLDDAAAMVRRLRDRVGVSAKLDVLGVSQNNLDEILDDCMERQDMVNNAESCTRQQAQEFLASML
jgi:alcohol dehydrogenase class IV